MRARRIGTRCNKSMRDVVYMDRAEIQPPIEPGSHTGILRLRERPARAKSPA